MERPFSLLRHAILDLLQYSVVVLYDLFQLIFELLLNQLMQ
jgi:hypothetical protein